MQPPPGERDADRGARVARRLALIGPGPAAFYDDAVGLAFGTTPVRMTVHFVAHALREIDSSIRDVLLPVNFVVAKKDRKNRHAAEIRRACLELGFQPEDNEVRSWTARAGILHEIAHRRALGLPTHDRAEVRTLVSEWDAVFDPILDRYESRYQAVVPRIIALAGTKSPSDDHLKQLRNNIPNNAGALILFFDKLSAGDWLPLIDRGGFFDHPPSIDFDPDSRTMRVPRWPQAEYLARFATFDIDLTVRVAARVQIQDNFRVAAALLEALNRIPPERAAEVVPQVRRWLQIPILTLVDDQAILLSERLARAGLNIAARDITLALIDAHLGVRAKS